MSRHGSVEKRGKGAGRLISIPSVGWQLFQLFNTSEIGGVGSLCSGADLIYFIIHYFSEYAFSTSVELVSHISRSSPSPYRTDPAWTLSTVEKV